MPRLRKSQDVVPNGVVAFVPFDQKTFLAALDMIQQRTVRETEASNWFVLVD
jgi:hypothetical protein